MAEEKLPLTDELIFMKYIDGADADEDDEEESKEGDSREIRHGYVFFYPSINVCKIIECDVQNQSVADDLAEFEGWICKVLFLLNEQIPLRYSQSR